MSLLLYLLKSGLLVAALTGLYYLLMRKDRLFRFNRAYMLAVLPLGLLLPLLTLPGAAAEALPAVLMPEFVMGAAPAPAEGTSNTAAFPWVMAVWLAGVMTTLGLTAVRLLRMWRTIARGASITGRGYIGIPTQKEICSFGPYILAPEPLLRDPAHPIIRHELAHVQQRHTVDVLLVTVLGALHWWNPAIHLLLRALRETHEYLADAAVLRCEAVSPEAYSGLMVRYACQPLPLALGNHFSHSQIKNRLSMIYTPTRTGAAIARRWLALHVVLLFAFIVVDKPLAAQTEISETEQEPAFKMVEEMPEYPGGTEALFKLISDNVKYPKSCMEDDIEGTVFVQFVITKEGKVKNLKVLKGVHEDMDKEALRVLGLMKDWTPGRQKGKAVPVEYTLPIRFALG